MGGEIVVAKLNVVPAASGVMAAGHAPMETEAQLKRGEVLSLSADTPWQQAGAGLVGGFNGAAVSSLQHPTRSGRTAAPQRCRAQTARRSSTTTTTTTTVVVGQILPAYVVTSRLPSQSVSNLSYFGLECAYASRCVGRKSSS